MVICLHKTSASHRTAWGYVHKQVAACGRRLTRYIRYDVKFQKETHYALVVTKPKSRPSWYLLERIQTPGMVIPYTPPEVAVSKILTRINCVDWVVCST